MSLVVHFDYKGRKMILQKCEEFKCNSQWLVAFHSKNLSKSLFLNFILLEAQCS